MSDCIGELFLFLFKFGAKKKDPKTIANVKYDTNEKFVN